MRALRMLAACLALGAAGLGCDELFGDLTTFTISTDPQKFRVDTAALGLTVSTGAAIPAIPCSDNDVCALASAQLTCNGATYACQVVCGASKSCAVTASTEQTVPVDISSKVKNNTQASALSKVSLQRLALTVRQNTLNFKTPAIEVFVGPGTAQKTTDAGVVRLGTIPVIEPGQTPAMNIETTEEGKAKLSELVRNYTVPFKTLARVSLTFASGAPIPQGALELEIVAYLEVEAL